MLGFYTEIDADAWKALDESWENQGDAGSQETNT